MKYGEKEFYSLLEAMYLVPTYEYVNKMGNYLEGHTHESTVDKNIYIFTYGNLLCANLPGIVFAGEDFAKGVHLFS